MKKVLLAVVFLLGGSALAQTANDCSNAIVVCGNNDITSNVSGFGAQELDNPNNPCALREVNSLWLQLNIDRSGSLEFTLTPDDPDIMVDYDFYIFGPGYTCDSDSAPIRCSTTNPNQAGLSNNLTGLRSGEMDVSEGPGELGNSFIAPLDVLVGETYYLMIDRPEGNGGFSLDWQGSSDFIDPPAIIGNPDPIAACFADVGTPLDITQNEGQITTDPGLFFEYYTSRENAFDGVERITDPTAYTIDASGTLYIKATNGNSCFEILEQRINIDPPFSTTLEYFACDGNNDGSETFQLAPIFDDIAAGLQNPTNYTVSLHASENDADSDFAAITVPTYDTPGEDIFARIASNADASCFLTVPVKLSLRDTPVVPPAVLLQCDIDQGSSTDGITTFDLEQIFTTVTSVETFDYDFYESEALRDSDRPIANLNEYLNITPFSQIIYYKITTDSCESFGEIELSVVATTVVQSAQSPLISCDTDFEDGILEATFDLDAFRNTHFPATEIAFYPTLNDASLERNAVSGQIVSGDSSLYIRIEDDNQCRTVEELRLRVNPLSEIDLNREFYICEENPELVITGPLGFDGYFWSMIDGATANEIAATGSVTITAAGNYRLTVEKSVTIDGQTVSCSNQLDFTVLPSNPAQITDIFVTGSGNDTTLEVRVSGEGMYEYSINGSDYSTSNLIENIASGSVTVFVRDKNGCGEVQETVSVFGYPKFFTPNGDAVNDFWQVIGADPKSSTAANIAIFDRYGKFVGQIDPLGQGWDGTYNDEPLPESDYWFRVKIDGRREIKGHFTLKR